MPTFWSHFATMTVALAVGMGSLVSSFYDVRADDIRADEPGVRELPNQLAADQLAADQLAADQLAADQSNDQQLRAWLGEQLTALVAEPHRKQEVLRQLQGLTPEQLRLVARQYQQQLAQRQLAEAQLLRNRLLQQQQLQQQFVRQGQDPRVAGFRPVISTLPEGAQLNASALISPDGRYVRIQAIPFFSYVPDVQTFNFATGQVGRLPGYGYPRRPRPPQVWYDGLRTRYGRPPGG
jgi:hypothetical protein